jgi:hypothetical protein
MVVAVIAVVEAVNVGPVVVSITPYPLELDDAVLLSLAK